MVFTDPFSPQEVRTQGDPSNKMVSRIIDKTVDGNGMTVDSDSNAHVEVHGNSLADGTTDKTLALSETGRPNSDGVYNASTNSKPAHVGLVARAQNASPADSQQTKRITAKDSASDGTTSMHVIPRPENGEANAFDNPFFVAVAENPGAEVMDYFNNGGVNVPANTTVTHDYTVTTAKKFVGDAVECACSGKGKFELQVETGVSTGIFTTKMVKTTTGSRPETRMPLYKRMTVAAGVRIRLLVTNEETTPNLDMAMYTTLIGVENP